MSAEVEAALIAWLERDVPMAFPYDWHALLATVTALVAAERERCAQVADRLCDFACAGTPSAIRQAPSRGPDGAQLDNGGRQ